MPSANNSSKVTLFCVVAMMMMMMKMMMVEAAAMPTAKHPRTHTEASDGAEAEMIPLQIDNQFLRHYRSVRPLQNASISPWTYNITNDATLVPPFLSEARCLLRGCLDLDGVEDLNLESRPIMHQAMLLRRVKSKGAEHGYHYRLESRLLAVGCTCVRPTIQYQN
ncbi:hypothetical protein CesoFtcFv8_000489 [Champsocephalus esox]|uniref:Uncharacterized protein n=1 Tax=Champsocephalus esox TaxID=159716 RepID=A0AAN8HGH8_9TELE|nr:hypothetical protein CesoFtcFv8_000489 [Champsocephalus esox]